MTHPSPLCSPAIPRVHPALIYSTGHLFLCLCHQACGSAAHSLTAGFFELMIAVPPLLLLVSYLSPQQIFLLGTLCGGLASVMFSSWSLLLEKQMLYCYCLYVGISKCC